MTPSTAEDRITKAARLLLLLEMDERGELAGLTLTQIARLFPAPPNRSTIMRDLRLLPHLRAVRDEMRKHATSKKPAKKSHSAQPRKDDRP